MAAAKPAQDTLNPKQLAKQAGFTWEFVSAHPDLLALFRKAVKDNWIGSPPGQKLFDNALKDTKWYQENSQWARTYALNAAKGGADWDAQKATASEAVLAEAARIGANLDGQALQFFTDQYLANGWYESGRDGLLTKALAGELPDFTTDHIDYGRGGAQSVITQLRDLARNNGVRFDDSYFNGAARSVLAGLTTIDDYAAEIRKTAASYDPAHADRILAGENRRDIASPYINMYADMYDKDPNTVDLDDPMVKAAMNRVDDKGNISAMGLWDYEKHLKSQPEYGTTKRAWTEVGNITSELVRMMGFGG